MQMWMVQLSFKQKPDEATLAMLPREREHVARLVSEGVIKARYVAKDGSFVWLVFSGETQADVESSVKTLPMYDYFDIKMIEVNA